MVQSDLKAQLVLKECKANRVKEGHQDLKEQLAHKDQLDLLDLKEMLQL